MRLRREGRFLRATNLLNDPGSSQTRRIDVLPPSSVRYGLAPRRYRFVALLAQWPEMPATVIAEGIGWDRGLTVLKDRIRDLRPTYRPADPASRTVYEPGEIGQCDLWFPSADIPLGFGQVGRPPVLVMVAGYSRWITARMLPSRSAADLITGHWRLLTELGAVPRVLVWDNEGAVGSWRPGGPQLTDGLAAFAGLLGIKFLLFKPRDPEAKGLVERANGYLETSFLPGQVFTRRPTSTCSSPTG
ncbi:hypothetical protein ABT040_35815 [Streptomyces sp. NPDC002688]|uniref:hypothetical protein n=1 Tax=Streptomyces sp. NPDC002688 TaxID=3154423 RepID=UPI003320F008